jgi:GTP-binding protein
VLVYLVDAGEDGCARTLSMLRSEVAAYSAVLAAKPSLIVATKLDLEGAEERCRAFASEVAPQTVLGVSSLSGRGIPELRRSLARSREVAHAGASA